MLHPNDLWLMDDEASDVLLTLPEIRQLVDAGPPDEQLGLRSMLERPETLSKAWWHGARVERHHGASRTPRRHADTVRAA